MKVLTHNLKSAIFLMLIMISGKTAAQAKLPFYEQLAFDFYQTKILDSFPVKKKITVYKYISDLNKSGYYYSVPHCIGDFKDYKFQFSVLKNYAEHQAKFDIAFFELVTDSINKKQFRVKKKLKGPYPKLFISPPIVYENNEARIYINIYEKRSETICINYCLEFDPDGKVINWCRKENIIYIES